MAATPRATIKSNTNGDIRTMSAPSGVTRSNVSLILDELTDSCVNLNDDRPLLMMGAWDASTNAVPSAGGPSILAGYMYENGNHVSTTLLDPSGSVIQAYATIRALVDNPGPLLSDPTKWRLTY